MSITRRTLVVRSLATAAVLPLVAARAQAAAHQVTMTGMAFSPAALAIAAGDTVTFINNDPTPHTATSTAFDTGRLNRGQQAGLTFPSPGSFAYACSFHPMMTGTITVA